MAQNLGSFEMKSGKSELIVETMEKGSGEMYEESLLVLVKALGAII